MSESINSLSSKIDANFVFDFLTNKKNKNLEFLKEIKLF